MRPINIQDISGDETLARTIYDIDGRVLLNQGVTLKPSYIQKLYDMGIFNIYIDDSISEEIDIHDSLSLQTRILAKQALSQELNRFSRTGEFQIHNLNHIVNDIVIEILSSRIEFIPLKDIRLKEEHLYAHPVNVCILSVMLAAKLGYNRDKVKSIGLGALLHDFGKIKIPSNILIKENNFSADDMMEIRKHPLHGYNIIKNDTSISSTSKIAILMHHEHLDGSGYPLGLSGDKIHYSAQIVSICNLYDNILHDHSHKGLLSTADAVERIFCSTRDIQDKSFVDAFLGMVPTYPKGTLVLLSNGFIGIVIGNITNSLTRPVVRQLYNPKTKEQCGNHSFVDLMKELSIKVLREIRVSSDEIKQNMR